MAHTRFNIAVTGLNATDNPGPGVTVVRALQMAKEFTGNIIGLTYDGLDPGLYHEPLNLAGAFILPYPSHGTEALLERLRYVHSVMPIDVLIPTLDAELPAMIAIEDELHKMGIHTYLPTRDQLDLRSKVRLADLGRTGQLRIPKQVVISDVQDIYALEDTLTYPLLIKGVFYGAQICQSVDEAVSAFHHTTAKWGIPVIAQKFHDGDEYDVVAVGDGLGNMVGAVPMKKLYITDKGKAWAGVVVRDPELMRVAQQFIALTKWRGPCEVEVMRTVESKYYLIVVNPRFPAWTVLSAGAGQNLPWAVAQLAMGDVVAPMTEFKSGVMFVRIAIDQITSIEKFQQITTAGELLAGKTTP